jgi:serine/threonine-protein kinase
VRTLGGRYRLEEAIGEGGMGVVWRAFDQELERRVAVKLVAGDDAFARERFAAEAKRTAALRHPAIVDVFDVGSDGADVFLVMELLEGETLASRLAREERLAPQVAVRIAMQVCDALDAAHASGFLHRDLKPANVFLVEDGERVKLIDFGIAKRIDYATKRTDPNVLVGTIEYMAPEQIKGAHLDGRTDLYALGLTLFRAITGRHAFAADNVAALIHQQLDVAPPPMGAGSAAIEAVVARLLAKDPKRRPNSAREAKRALLDALESPDVVRPEGSMRVVELDEAPAAPLDLAGGARVGSAGAIATMPPPLPPPPPARVEMTRRPLPSWAEPLARVPEPIAKRLVGYPIVAIGIAVVFFGAPWPFVVGSAIVSAIGAAAMWAHARMR